jgi:thiamine biosynthesis lipoprotein
MLSRRRFIVLLGGAGTLGALTLPWSSHAPAGLRCAHRSSRALGTTVSITVLHEEKPAAERALDDAFRDLETIEETMSLYRPGSELSRLNRYGSLSRPHPHLLMVLRRALRMASETGGAFDPTVQPLWSLHADASRAGRTAEAAAVELARRRVDWHRVAASEEAISLGEGTEVTLNGIAQGFAADCVAAVLGRHGIRHALIDTGELLGLGRKEGGAPWRVGIQHPRQDDAYLTLLDLDGRSLATSGDYSMAFSADRSLNHIFDPATGRSPPYFSSVTVAAPSGMEADALSTTIFVLGPERGLDLVRRSPGADALLVLKDGRMLSTLGFPKLSVPV